MTDASLDPQRPLPMTGKVCLITGGTGGIGLVTARMLARLGAAVTIVGRDRERGEAALALLREAAPGASITFLAGDLSSQSEVRRVAAGVASLHPCLDVLINNAGGLFGRRRLSADGIEMTFALNHLGYFLLSHLLMPQLSAAPRARIVNVASAAHKGVTLDFDDLQGEERYNRWLAYKRSKLCNILFTYELARRHRHRQPARVHPGLPLVDRQALCDQRGTGSAHQRVPGKRVGSGDRERPILRPVEGKAVLGCVL